MWVVGGVDPVMLLRQRAAKMSQRGIGPPVMCVCVCVRMYLCREIEAEALNCRGRGDVIEFLITQRTRRALQKTKTSLQPCLESYFEM